LETEGGETVTGPQSQGACERCQVRAALEELVALKDLKDSEGQTPEYLARQPAAWSAARAALVK
jgi:hypothetical protein